MYVVLIILGSVVLTYTYICGVCVVVVEECFSYAMRIVGSTVITYIRCGWVFQYCTA